jgi:DNA-binding transcriptional LysR family regulator
VQLVKRTTRRVEPTEIGMRLYEHGRNIHNEMLAAREAITALGQPAGACRPGACPAATARS